MTWDDLPDDPTLPADGKWAAFEAWRREGLLVGDGFRNDERAILFIRYKTTHDYGPHPLADAPLDK